MGEEKEELNTNRKKKWTSLICYFHLRHDKMKGGSKKKLSTYTFKIFLDADSDHPKIYPNGAPLSEFLQFIYKFLIVPLLTAPLYLRPLWRYTNADYYYY